MPPRKGKFTFLSPANVMHRFGALLGFLFIFFKVFFFVLDFLLSLTSQDHDVSFRFSQRIYEKKKSKPKLIVILYNGFEILYYIYILYILFILYYIYCLYYTIYYIDYYTKLDIQIFAHTKFMFYY